MGKDGEGLELRFDRHLATLAMEPGPALVAVSGGADSVALLTLLVRSPAAAEARLVVAHVDHAQHEASAAIAARVEALAAELQLPFTGTRLDLPSGTGETALRAARYGWLAAEARRREAASIVTAHHRDDQVETVLMRLLKGSGPAGLAGMAARRGVLLRPLLSFTHQELAEYLRGLGRSWWEDPANSDPRHERVWLRGTVLPTLRTRLPGIDRNLLSLARQAAAGRDAWDALLEQLPGLDLDSSSGGVSVAATPLRGYDSATLRALLGALGRRAGCVVGPARAARIEQLLGRGRSGAVAELGAGFAAEFSCGRLRLFREAAHRPQWGATVLEGKEGGFDFGPWRVTWREEPAPGRLERAGSASWFSSGIYIVRPWRAGDRIRPLGASGRRLVVRCLQDARIPRSRRLGWPVLEAEGTIVWVPDVCRSAERLPEPGSRALRIDAEPA